MPVAITGSTSIDYDISGEGPPLLLIGGLGFGRWGWFKQVPAFSRHFRTITFDVRGERRLENGVGDLVGEVVSLLGHLGVKKAHVLGTSLGGFVAQELALVRPDLVERLVLVCTSYGGRGPESMSPQALSDMLGWGSFSAEGMVSRGLETATSETYRAEHLDEFEQIIEVLRQARLPTCSELLSRSLCLAALEEAKRHRGGSVNLVVPAGIGNVAFVQERDLPARTLIAAALRRIRSGAPSLVVS